MEGSHAHAGVYAMRIRSVRTDGRAHLSVCKDGAVLAEISKK